MKSDTVFGHLVHQFSIHPENLATEALCFILRTSPAASRAFTEFIRQIGFDCPGDLYFETQRGGLDQSIPDMKCHDDKGRLRVIVENKFWAGLTENQPVTYIRELPDGVTALVLFVVPKARLQLVWDEVVARCRNAKIPVNDIERLTAMTAAHLGEEHYLAATSWTYLLDALSLTVPSAGEIDRRNDIVQLRGLCRTMDEEEILPIRGDELTNLEMARRIINFSDLPFGIVDEAASRELCTRKNETNYRHASGVYIQIGGYTAWVGFDLIAWRSRGVSPIWVIFPRSAQIAEIRKKLLRFCTAVPQRFFDSDSGKALVPLFLATGVEKQRIIEDAVNQIRELATELGVREPQDKETILEMGAEGGTLTLFGNRDDAGHWRFWTQTDETTMNDLLDEEDRRGLGSLVNTRESVSSLTEAFALLGKYPWHCMVPLQLHPEFLTVILSEVQKRGTPEEVASWNSHVKRL